jgi:hypothetical protein
MWADEHKSDQAPVPVTGSTSQHTDDAIPKIQQAGAALEAGVRSGLADCPITKSRGYRKRVQPWTGAVENVEKGEATVSWLPLDILRTFGAELRVSVLPISGSNSRSLFYFALPGESIIQETRQKFLATYPDRVAENEDLDARFKFFFANRGNPRYQLTSVPGALTDSEDQFLYGNLGRMMYRTSCLTTAQAALESQFTVPVVRVTSALDMAARSSRSTLVFYGTFQSPLWFMLSGERGPSAEAEALIAIWNLYAGNESSEVRSYVTNFTGWLLLYVQGKEISANAALSGGGGASFGIGSISGSAGSVFKMDETLGIQSYELLVEPKTMQFGGLPSKEDIIEGWDRSHCRSSTARGERLSKDTVKARLQIPGLSEGLCTRVSRGDTTVNALDKSDKTLSGVYTAVVGTGLLRDGVCEIPITLSDMPDAATHAYVWFVVGKPIVAPSPSPCKQGKRDDLSHFATISW